MINYKEIEVWSCGGKNATRRKCFIAAIMLVIALLSFVIVWLFVNPFMRFSKFVDSELADCLLSGMFVITTIGWIEYLMIVSVIDSIQVIKRNKRIKLYICYKNLSDSEIPSDKIMLNKYDEGIILADKDYEKESMDFHLCMKGFAEYEQLYQNMEKKE